LYDYECLLPADWTVSWLSTSDSPTADSLLYAVRRDWKDGSSQSRQLLLPGILRRHTGWID
jgi:hypothetical protein